MRSKRWLAGSILAIVACCIGLGIYFLNSLNIEELILCSDGRGYCFPRTLCREYLYTFRGTPGDIAMLNDSIGLQWVLNYEHKDERRRLFDFLLKRGIDVNGQDPNTGMTALHASILVNDPQMVEWLLSVGARLDIKDNRLNLTPIQLIRLLVSREKQPDRSEIMRILSKAQSGQV
jgi:hypothetical protein